MYKREIRFKGFAQGLPLRWVEGDLEHHEGQTFIRNDRGYVTAVYPDSVCQFTGRTDSRGFPIYEGDIVATPEYRGFVKWMEQKCCFQFHPYGISIPGECTVVGNIYERPEMYGEARTEKEDE